uniref:Ig-like domain-containing protein n=1 Tax=Podarcis muralis TaxID=64176 RepID=A0A670JBT9_PODMU
TALYAKETRFILWVLQVGLKENPSLKILEGTRISCKHGLSTYDSVFWYKQTQNAAPSIVIYSYSKTEKKERLEMDTDKGNLSTELSISKVEMGDAGIYHCAASDTVVGNARRLETSDPSVYKLQSAKEEDRDISACLITDFLPAPIRVGADGIDEHEVNGSIVVVKESGKEIPSYGKVIWGKAKETDGCYAEQNNNRFPSESAGKKHTRLNLLSLTVIGLRVIFLKCVAFNLLFTFHAWSS